MKLGATVRLRRADLDCLFEKRLPYSKEERIIKLAESRAGASTEEELNEDIADKYVSKKEACVILGEGIRGRTTDGNCWMNLMLSRRSFTNITHSPRLIIQAASTSSKVCSGTSEMTRSSSTSHSTATTENRSVSESVSLPISTSLC